MASRRWDTKKDINTRHDSDGYWGRGGSTVRYIGKGQSGEYFRMQLELDLDFAGMEDGRISQVLLWLTTNEGPSGWEIGSKAGLKLYRNTEDFDNDSSDVWSHEAYEMPKCDTGTVWHRLTGIPTTPEVPFSIDITSYIRRKAPKSVDVLIGTEYKPGYGETDHGLRIRATEDDHSENRVAVWSGDGSTLSSRRPYAEAIWEPKNTKPITGWGQPSGGTASGQRYTGTYFDAQGQRISAAEVKVWRNTDPIGAGGPDSPDTKPRWQSTKRDSEASWPDDQYDLTGPPPGTLPKMSGGSVITYKGAARTWDSKDKASDWTDQNAAGSKFTITSDSPDVSPVPMNSQSDLGNVLFKAPWTYDSGAHRITSYRVQLTNRFDSGVWGQVLWDHTFVPTAAEQADAKTTAPVRQGQASFKYGGPNLVGGTSPVGDYSWRIMVTDGLGEDSVWREDNSLHLTKGVVGTDDPADTTQYGRVGVTTRLVMRAVDIGAGKKRAPGKVVAIIENPSDLAVSGYATTAGQLSFTLPNRHPQISAMEPMKTHWSLQQYRGSQWRELNAGLLTDFDATENDTVFTGLDYLGVLSLSIETQTQPVDGQDKQFGKGGAKYFKKTIGYIINHQLGRAIGQANSPLGFFKLPAGSIDSALSEPTTIHAAFVQRLDFIRGLLDSHRGGATGRRSRITAAQNPTNGQYEFSVRSNAGKDRKNIRLQFGGITQAYRVMGLGDWGDRVYAVGRFRNELQPHYATMTAPNVSLSDWGEIAKTNVWQDLADDTDLQRRARSMALEISRVGKRVALGLRVQGLMLLDGWNICDNVIIDIDDGTVNTMLYGTSGWWTVWGWEWRLFSDGHEDLTLVVRPREDVSSPVVDLIPSRPMHIQPEWTVGHGGK